MDKLAKFKSKPVPKKKTSLHKNTSDTNKKPTDIASSKKNDTDAREPGKVMDTAADDSEKQKQPKKRQFKIVDGTSKHDPRDLLAKINPSMLVFLNKKNTIPIVELIQMIIHNYQLQTKKLKPEMLPKNLNKPEGEAFSMLNLLKKMLNC